MKGVSKNSPDPNLNHLTPILFNSSAALKEKGVHKYLIFSYYNI